jgi:glycine/D-amino acid oxidase-like deaminating enzyme
LATIIQTLDASKPRNKTDPGSILREIAETGPRRGMIILLSDLLGDVDSTLRGLRLLRQRGHDVIVLHVMDDDELDFPFDGPTRFEGLEVPDHLNCNPRALRDGYLAALERFLTELRRGCARDAVEYALIRTSDPLDAALATFISRRMAATSRH